MAYTYRQVVSALILCIGDCALREGIMLSLIFYKMPIKERYANIFYKRLGGLNGSPFFIKVQPFNLSQI